MGQAGTLRIPPKPSSEDLHKNKRRSYVAESEETLIYTQYMSPNFEVFPMFPASKIFTKPFGAAGAEEKNTNIKFFKSTF